MRLGGIDQNCEAIIALSPTLQAGGIDQNCEAVIALSPSLQIPVPELKAEPEPRSDLQSPPPPAAAHKASGNQTLTITGLRFDANLGILDHERTAPQPIQVDAELNLGPQPLLPHDDDIGHVLDYRKVRQIVITECTAEHVNLLESLIGKLAHRLLQLPGVVGVRVKIAKLKIFNDCEVAIRIETGQW
ncbi:MAG: dihydroneopterin aldolase [Polaromonas sp.]|nr:dihydroneopterin aldolase [Polaromonas sp.]